MVLERSSSSLTLYSRCTSLSSGGGEWDLSQYWDGMQIKDQFGVTLPRSRPENGRLDRFQPRYQVLCDCFSLIHTDWQPLVAVMEHHCEFLLYLCTRFAVVRFPLPVFQRYLTCQRASLSWVIFTSLLPRRPVLWGVLVLFTVFSIFSVVTSGCHRSRRPDERLCLPAQPVTVGLPRSPISCAK